MLFRAMVIVALGGLLGACGFGVAPEADTDGTDVAATQPGASQEAVRIGFAAYEYERQMFEPLIKTFNEQNPDIQVQFVALDGLLVPGAGGYDADEMMRRIVSSADTAASFDLRSADVEKGYVRDLAPLIAADASFDRDDYFARALGGDEQGRLFLLPRTLRLPLLSYNKELWAASGLPDPQPGWTWADLLGAAEQLAQKRGDEVEVYGLLDPWGDAVLGGLLGESDAALSGAGERQVALDQPAVVATLERIADLLEAGAIYIPPGVKNGTLDPSSFQELINDGRIALWSSDMLFSGPDGDGPQFEVGAVPFPEPVAGFIGGNQGYIMSSGTQHPEAAWRWLSFLSHQTLSGGPMRIEPVSAAPARRSLAEAEGYWDRLDGAMVDAVRALLDQPAKGGSEVDPLVLAAVKEALLATAFDGQEARAALGAAQATLDQQTVALAEADATADAAPIVVATPEPDVAPEGATTITFVTPSLNIAPLRALAREFAEQHPEIYVDVQQARFDGQMLNLASAAEAADCFSWWSEPAPDDAELLLDLQPLLDADPSFDRDDYPAALLARLQRDGKLLGLPLSVSLRVLNYNPALFEAAGLEPPQADWTLDTLIDAAERLTSGEGGDKQYGFASNGAQTEDVLFFLDQQNVAITAGSGDTLAPNYTDPRVITALRAYIDFVRSYTPHTSLQGYSYDSFGNEGMGLIQNGQVGMWFDGGLRMVVIGGGPTEQQRAIAPPPMAGAAGDDKGIVGLSGLFISARTEQAQACWEWLKFLSADPSTVEGGFDFPARRSIAESAAFLNAAPQGAAEVYTAYSQRLSQAQPMPAPSEAATIDGFWFYQAIDRAIQGGDLERELEAAQAFAEQYLACVRGGTEPATCATQVDPTYNGFQQTR